MRNLSITDEQYNLLLHLISNHESKLKGVIFRAGEKEDLNLIRNTVTRLDNAEKLKSVLLKTSGVSE